MYDIVVKILQAVIFIAAGGTVALIFFFVFAQTITGSKSIHTQLDEIHKQIKELNENIRKIAETLSRKKE